MDIKEIFSELNDKINAFFAFVIGKLKNFKNLSLGEQVGFGCASAGLLLILISIILFIV